MTHIFWCQYYGRTTPEPGCVCDFGGINDEEDEMQKLNEQTKVEILKSKERQLIDAIAEESGDKQKQLDALQSVRAALRRCEGEAGA